MQPNFNSLFSEFPDYSRVWLYLSDRKLEQKEVAFVTEQLNAFTSQWAAHNKQLMAAGVLLFDQYIVLTVNEEVESASGCSIDSSVRFIKSLGQQLHVDFFNRLKVLVVENGATQLVSYFDATAQQMHYLDPMITNLGELRSNWLK